MVEKILIVALFSYGYCATFWPEQIFHGVGEWLSKRLPEWLCKPMFDCPLCNSFWVATLIYWIFWGNVWHEWIIISVCSIGVNAVIVNLINKVEDISDAIKPPNEPPLNSPPIP